MLFFNCYRKLEKNLIDLGILSTCTLYIYIINDERVSLKITIISKLLYNKSLGKIILPLPFEHMSTFFYTIPSNPLDCKKNKK